MSRSWIPPISGISRFSGFRSRAGFIKRNIERNFVVPPENSGSIVTQLAQLGLIDEYQIMVGPVLLGEGTPIFKGIKEKLNLKLITTRTFKSGVILLCYQPMEI
ncbi:MAG: dihydrofolate reductase family protein [Ignavibacteriales bacterium]|nr:dihydrofolate reductase family protein [Ignavibacteriales bacterium]